MSNYLSDIAETVQSTISGQSARRVEGNLLGGQLAMARAVFRTESSMAVGDTIQLVRLPKGSVLVPHLSQIMTEALGTTLNVNIGDQGNSSRYAAALDIKAAGSHLLMGTVGMLNPVELDESGWITATITAASGVTAGKTATAWIAYIHP